MGAWDVGSFDNDLASDWAHEFDGLDESAGFALLAEALERATGPESVDEWNGSIGIAAAEVVSWLCDRRAISRSPYGEAAAEWAASTTAVPPSADLIAAALAALDHVRSDESELAELWVGDDAAWRKSLARTESRLRTPPGSRRRGWLRSLFGLLGRS